MNDGYVWLAYLVAYGLIGGYGVALVGRRRRRDRS
jgi:hypothetical protein